jgi:hypothetical protein
MANDTKPELTDEQLGLGGYRVEDLEERRIVENRTDLRRKIAELGFPKPVKTGKAQTLFLKAEVHDWLRKRAALRDAPEPVELPAPPPPPAPPQLTAPPPVQTVAPPPRRPVGRLRKTPVINQP